MKNHALKLKNATYEGEQDQKLVFIGKLQGTIYKYKLKINECLDTETSEQMQTLKESLQKAKTNGINIYQNIFTDQYKFIIKEA